MPDFHDVRFPEEISYGSKGGPRFLTQIITLASGKERRNMAWTKVRAEYDVMHGIKDADQMEELRNFFYARRGRAYSFRFKDHSDFFIMDQDIATADGTETVFQMIKTYESGGYSYDRTISKLVSGTLEDVLVDGVAATLIDDYTVNYDTGEITFNVAPAADAVINIPYVEFDVHVRFDTDHFDPVHDFWQVETWDSIVLVEIKD